ncbi:NUDIX hydrolase [Bacillus cytotoxicus]|uniref:NUDIX hydrolase n=2 Tax=Bacillus cytotoxicus TaxID=580165 RepID=A0AAX2CK53_9BACI|nr:MULTISPECIES: NUDIX hydrolase [Bacillus cereus group]ABS23085.1 NUDIX hydrolase [Bacillus cytotoxicus NVH 391-98]AWC29736.1 NUDIX domain-containing protein [Bacillus cytotoxicus]AWC33741.1 NUDIX domain-containing protein [Bacillus cytotoxicus]AWC37720.1 NUDIX domain-containing protein [Bacillus cytotoxicus]AWC41867.1 NUDIX domain-containing protein [Bacillus cytotoxicus]
MGYVEELRKIVGHRPLILVGAVVLVINKKGEVLLQQRTEPYGKWGLPGGLMELGESPEETAYREVYEETGIHVKNLRLIHVFSGANYFTKLANGDEFQSVTTAYYTDEYEGNLNMNTAEAVQLAFFPIRELPDYMVGSHKKIIETYEKIEKENKNAI